MLAVKSLFVSITQCTTTGSEHSMSHRLSLLGVVYYWKLDITIHLHLQW